MITQGKYEIIHTAVHKDNNLLSVSKLCEIAGVSRSGYYAWIEAAPTRETREAADQKDFEEGVRFVEDNWKILGLDRMVTDRLGLSEIHRAIEMMLTGENICKIVIDPTR